MKKYILSLALSCLAILPLSAMSYEEAREQARFLTDKMAYELNFNDQQYNDCYEINLDYFLSVQTAGDVYGDYLSYRNADLRHILYDWQYSLFVAADYFFRPLSFYRGTWLLPVYHHYNAGHFYYSHPAVYFSYRGGHGRPYFHTGYYTSRRPHWNGGFRGQHHGSVVHHSRARDHHAMPALHHSSHGRQPGYHIGARPSHHSSGRGSNQHYDRPSSTRTTVHSSPGRGGDSHVGRSSDHMPSYGNSRSHSLHGSNINAPSHSGGGSHSRGGSGGFGGQSRGSRRL